VAEVIMGLVFLVSGLVKVWEPVLFYWDVAPYSQLLGLKATYWQHVSTAALVLAPLECLLGVALLVNWRPRAVLPAAAVLMAFFVGLMIAAWRAGATDECGCFGALLQRGPGQAAIEDAGMLVLVLFAWWRMRAQPAWHLAGRTLLVAGVLAFALGGVRLHGQAFRMATSDLEPGVRLTGLEPRGVDTDLMRGELLLELMSPSCGHCVAAVPRLNAIVEQPGLPRVVALNTFAQDSPQLSAFKQQHKPLYPIGTVSRTDFFRLTHGHGFPRLAYVRDGIVKRVWERSEFPTPQEITALMSGG
jgi:thiol-disulfide isomerase/thioredoxin